MEVQAKDAVRRLFARAQDTSFHPLPNDSDLQVGQLQADKRGNKFCLVTDTRKIRMIRVIWRFYPPNADGVLLVLGIMDCEIPGMVRVAYLIDDPEPLLRPKVRFSETCIPDVDAFVARIWHRDQSVVNHAQVKDGVRRLFRATVTRHLPPPGDSDLQVGEPQEDKTGNKFCKVTDVRNIAPAVTWRFYPPNDEDILMVIGIVEGTVIRGRQMMAFLVEDPDPLIKWEDPPGVYKGNTCVPDVDEFAAKIWHRDLSDDCEFH
ncbi:uncharacterized protein LOC9651058 [Selaginella moellendorffii]|uniref:uncharacterized protein LOC9651058 n=1 Tax=Selaginella moellendorffii TaxID=88036 RepID=UPI000D1CF4C5|nr:uncharacterized protein LOC9651058 [Selaginella moellendorffii]|eukprot:XP_024533084.1 uncharacterized protein LOC9651058 [Selaginella moellendorffii]